MPGPGTAPEDSDLRAVLILSPHNRAPIEQKFLGFKVFNDAIKVLNMSTLDIMQPTSGAEPEFYC
jgi:hypothetical protein